MVHIDIVDLNSQLERQITTVGNVTRYKFDFSGVLGKGEKLFTANITPDSVIAAVSNFAFSSDKESCTFLVSTPIEEVFNLETAVTTTDSQTLQFVMAYDVRPLE